MKWHFQLLFSILFASSLVWAKSSIHNSHNHPGIDEEPFFFINSIEPTNPLAKVAKSQETAQEHLTEHFALYYFNSGPHAVPQFDGNGNSVPDYIDSLGVYAEETWDMLIDSLEYKEPAKRRTLTSGNNIVPSGKFPIEVVDIGTVIPILKGNALMGMARTRRYDPDSLGAILYIENDFFYNDGQDTIKSYLYDSLLYDYGKDKFTGLKLTMSHEFYHIVQFEYDDKNIGPFHESSAVWFEDFHRPEINDYWQYIPVFVENLPGGIFVPGRAAYGNSYYLKIFSFNEILKFWKEREITTFTSEETFLSNLLRDSLQDFQVNYGTQLKSLLFKNSGNFSDGNPMINYSEIVNFNLPNTVDRPVTLGGSPYSFTIKRIYSSIIDEGKSVKVSVSEYAQHLSENYSISIIDYHNGALEVYNPNSNFHSFNLKAMKDSVSICTIGTNEYSPNELTLLFSGVSISQRPDKNKNLILMNSHSNRNINGKKHEIIDNNQLNFLRSNPYLIYMPNPAKLTGKSGSN